MSADDELEISSGGAVAVDTASLRHAADRFHGEARQLHQLTERLRRQRARLEDAAAAWPETASRHISGRTRDLHLIAGALADGIDRIGGILVRAAAVYEIVEQRVAIAQAEAGGDARAMRLARARIDALAAGDPQLEKEADELVEQFESARTAQLRRVIEQTLPNGVPLAPLLNLPAGPPGSALLGVEAAALIGALGLGRMRGGTVGGDPGPVIVRSTGAVKPGRPPRGLADMLARIPSGGRGSLRVERYTMADGSHRYLAYLRGTRDWGLGGREPNNMMSNLQLYGRERSTSSKAALRAIEMAGARPGDAVDLVGHSQGAMMAGRIALDGGYRTELLVTAGSPTQAQVPGDVLSVELEHPDLVSDLKGAGSPAHVGSENSVVVRRNVRSEGGPPIVHGLPHYVETARQADASHDPRLKALDDRVAVLQDAVSVEVFEFDSVEPRPPKKHPPHPDWVPGMR